MTEAPSKDDIVMETEMTKPTRTAEETEHIMTTKKTITSRKTVKKNGWPRWVNVAVGLLCIFLFIMTTVFRFKYTFEGHQSKTEQDQLKYKQELLQTERDQLQTEQDQLKTERDQLKTERDQLKTERDQLKTERDQLKTKWDQLKMEQDQLKSRLSNLNQERDQLLSSNSNLRREKDQLMIEKITLTQKLPCPSGWSHYGKCYQVSYPGKTWHEARRVCQSMGGDLVTIDSEEEQVYINGLETWGWIGLHWQGARWTWVNYNSLYTGPRFWGPGQPNSKTENCVMSSPNTQNPTSNWHDYPCNSRFNAICEKTAN